MLIQFFVYSTAFLLFLIGCIHLYWTVGGKRAFYHSLPRKATGELLFVPKKIDCLIVGIGLIGFGFLLLAGIEVIVLPIRDVWVKNGSLIVGVIFITRALGDFKYLGFFKSVRNNPFAKYDSLYYSPISLYMGLTFILSA
jgi:hypothetical protein